MISLQGFAEWLNEQVQYNRELCPKVWDENKKMHSEIRRKLLEISRDFWDSLKLEVQVLDVQLTGSLANYNWTSSSDLDVHVIIDFSQVDENVELVRKALDGQRFIWNQRHPVELEGHDVECYVQHLDEQHISSGLYSILKDAWRTTPTWDPPQVDERDVNEKIRVIKSEFKKIKVKLLNSSGEEARSFFDYLTRFKKKIMADRKEGLAKGGEFSVENLVFKELRRDGTIESIIDTLSKGYGNIYND
jgi:predicted nucleotidyltransferase